MTDAELLKQLSATLKRQFRGALMGVGEGFKADDAAEAIDRTQREIEGLKLTVSILRNQIRNNGDIPVVQENEEVGKAEYEMRRRANSN